MSSVVPAVSMLLASLTLLAGSAAAAPGDPPRQNPSGPPNAVPPDPVVKPAPPPPPPPLFEEPAIELPVAPKTVTAVHRAEPPRGDSLWHVEARAGYGISAGGNGSRMATRRSPLTLEAIIAFALQDDPPLAMYGGLAVETIDRNTAGGTFGVTYRPTGGQLRLSGGGRWLVAPQGLLGATASVGTCRVHAAAIDFCGDVQLTSYFAGGDLADGHAVTQLQLVFGVVFDAR